MLYNTGDAVDTSEATACRAVSNICKMKPPSAPPWAVQPEKLIHSLFGLYFPQIQKQKFFYCSNNCSLARPSNLCHRIRISRSAFFSPRSKFFLVCTKCIFSNSFIGNCENIQMTLNQAVLPEVHIINPWHFLPCLSLICLNSFSAASPVHLSPAGLHLNGSKF